MGAVVTANRLFSQYSLILLPFLTVTVFSVLLAAVEANHPESSPPRASNVADAKSEPGDPSEAPAPPPEYDNRSYRSGPPDTTPYSRPAVPEDYEPQGKPAIPPGISVPPPGEPDRRQSSDKRDGGRLPLQ